MTQQKLIRLAKEGVEHSKNGNLNSKYYFTILSKHNLQGKSYV